MLRGPYVITWQTWTSDRSKSKSTRKQRRTLLKLWSEANARSVDDLLSAILSDTVTIYESTARFLDWLRDTKHKPSVVALYRTLLPQFFKSVLGAQNFDSQAFDLLVPNGDNYVTTTKKAPTLEEVQRMIELAGPRDKALIGLLCSGMRIGEAVSRKMSDLEVREDGHARVRLQAENTKKRRRRFVFLTNEAVQWIRDYHNGLNVAGSETWILPGERGEHLSEVSGYVVFKGSKKADGKFYVGLFEKAGLRDTDDEIYSPHSFRVFASSHLRRSGLNESWVDAITGHMSRLGAKSAYLDWDQIESEWLSKVHDNLLLRSVKHSDDELKQAIRVIMHRFSN